MPQSIVNLRSAARQMTLGSSGGRSTHGAALCTNVKYLKVNHFYFLLSLTYYFRFIDTCFALLNFNFSFIFSFFFQNP